MESRRSPYLFVFGLLGIAAGLWFIHMLKTGEIEPTLDDVLLAVYFLAWAEYQDVPGKG